jgi:sugar O-acyltransferase (sialic acid O-acetyltransferase NeuD family)
MTARVICLGNGGHASVIVDLLQLLAQQGQAEIVGVTGTAGQAADVLGVPTLGEDSELRDLVRKHELTHFIVGMGMVRGGDEKRARLFELGRAAGLRPFTAIHPTAIVASSATIGEGTAVMAGAIVQARTRIGANVILNTRSSVDHDCAIGDHVHVAPGAVCSGNVKIGEAAHIGVGAAVIQNVRIGAGATVAAGAVAVRDCPDGVTVMGVPAKPGA